MPLRQRLENLPVGQKLLAALLVLLITILLVANLTFISAAYYISQESMAPQALQTIGRLVSNPSMVADALSRRKTPNACSTNSTVTHPCVRQPFMTARANGWRSCSMATN